MSKLFNKYTIRKTDGSPTDPSAQYFVLRIDTDPAARIALRAYAEAVSRTEPLFAEALLNWVDTVAIKRQHKNLRELGF